MTDTTGTRALVPSFLKPALRRLTWAWGLRRARWDLRRRGAISPGTLKALHLGWGNLGWSGDVSYLRAVLTEAVRGSGPILECGSGLSTVLLGLTLEGSGRELWSLEHHEEWRHRVDSALSTLGTPPVTVCASPLKSFGDFTWYDAPRARLPRDFGLVVCDGPPGDIPGGRYGLMPRMQEHLAPGCTVLLDDTARPEERAVLARWREACPGSDVSESDGWSLLRLR